MVFLGSQVLPSLVQEWGNIKRDYRSDRERDCPADADSSATEGEQTAGNREEAPFPGSGCSQAGKEEAASGRDGDLHCLLGREQRERCRPTASMQT